MVIVEFLRAHSDFVLLSLIAFFVWYRRGKDISVGQFMKQNVNEFILVGLVVFFVIVTIWTTKVSGEIATAMLDNVKTVLGALLILINGTRGKDTPQAPVAPTPPAQGGA